jgi:hypothetical protein
VNHKVAAKVIEFPTFALLRFQTVTDAKPAFIRLRAIPVPMIPSPRNPTLMSATLDPFCSATIGPSFTSWHLGLSGKTRYVSDGECVHPHVQLNISEYPTVH